MNRLLILIAVLLLTAAPAAAQNFYVPAISTKTADYTVPQGCRKLTVVFSSTYTGNVLGTAFTGASDSSVTFEPPLNDPNGKLGAIVITVSAGSVRLIEVR